MDGLKVVKTFLQDLIRPIVVEAVKESIQKPAVAPVKKYLSVKEVEELYNMSTSAIYDRFTTGVLTKVKNGGKTYVLTEEIENSMWVKKFTDKKERKLSNRN